jgi:hypothetical protein
VRDVNDAATRDARLAEMAAIAALRTIGHTHANLHAENRTKNACSLLHAPMLPGASANRSKVFGAFFQKSTPSLRAYA